MVKKSDSLASDLAANSARVKPTTTPVVVDLSLPLIASAIAQGKAMRLEAKSKSDVAQAIFSVIGAEPKEVLVAAFVEGADLTPKGALTYWYNCRRKAAKAAKAAA